LALVVLPVSHGAAQSANGKGWRIANNTPGFVKMATDLGPVDPTTTIEVTVWLQLHHQNQLDQLLKSQNQQGSANYHKWITQDEFNASFSPTTQELDSVANYLNAHKLSTVSVAENHWYVKVRGTVEDVQKAFSVQLDNYQFNGQIYRGNRSDPSINDSSGAHVAAVTGLDDLGFQPALVRPIDPEGNPIGFVPLSSVVSPDGLFFEGHCFRGIETQTFTKGSNSATYTGDRYGSDITDTTPGHQPPCGYAPMEMQTAYNMNPLYAQGFDGSGQTVVITDAFGSSTIAHDADRFSELYGLPRITPDNFQLVKAPGLAHNPKGPDIGWDTETTLDVEWVHAMAPGAKIALITATNRASLDEAINLAVVRHLGNTISNSWSRREGLGNPAQFNRVNRILEQAAVQGIDVNFASGDCGDETVGSVDCPSPLPFKTVAFPASSPFATGVGGTSLGLNSDDTIAFQTGWGTNETRIADTVALGSPPVIPPLLLGFVFGAGGGSSLTFAKPDFQSGIPGTTRQVPDISMVADPFTGAEIIQTISGQTGVAVFGGTSLATPMFSAVMAVAAQKAGHGLGQAAPLVYGLPAGAIIDVANVDKSGNVTGTNTTSAGTVSLSSDDLAAPLDGVSNYMSAMYNSPFSTRWFVLTFGTDTSLSTGPGYDNVTGVGTPNGAEFVNAVAP
jgi:subtilase family serine protease